MYRIGLVGSENSHARAFAKVFSQDSDFSDLVVTAVCGSEGREKSEKVREYFPDAVIVDRPEEMLPLVDAVMITSRDGIFHYPYAKIFLEAGKPAFVDKPFTVDPEEARALIALAKEKKLPLCGGSSLKCCPDTVMLGERRRHLGANIRSGFASAPLQPDSPYSGFYFYASHLVELCLAVFGWEPEAVTAVQASSGMTVIFHYDGFDAVCSYTPGCYRYFVQLTGEDNVLEAKELDLEPAYRLEAEEFAVMLRTGVMPYSYEQLTEPVFCMNSIEESCKTGKRVPIRREEV